MQRGIIEAVAAAAIEAGRGKEGRGAAGSRGIISLALEDLFNVDYIAVSSLTHTYMHILTSICTIQAKPIGTVALPATIYSNTTT